MASQEAGVDALVKVEETALVPAAAPALEELVRRFVDAQDVAPSSRATYRRELRQFCLWLQETGLATRMETIRREDILAYKDHLEKAGKSAYTVSGYLVAVRRLFAWLESEKVYPDIARGVKGAKKARGFRKDCLTPAQIRETLEAIDRSTLEGLRDYALVNLLARTGLRTVEVSKAELGDLRQESGEAVLWIQGKGRDTKDDFVLLVDDTLKPLRRWLKARGPLTQYAPLFCSLSPKNYGEPLTTRSISRIAKNALKGAKLDSERLTAHSFRHTAVTLAIKGGASLEQAQAMARHSDPRTTQVYFHNVSRVEAGAEKYISF